MVGALPSIAFFKCIRLFSIFVIAVVIVVLVEEGGEELVEEGGEELVEEGGEELVEDGEEEEGPLTKDVGFRSLLNICCALIAKPCAC
jgi:hypothetical protein